jgi:Mrp family chromosome partitioning ATPase
VGEISEALRRARKAAAGERPRIEPREPEERALRSAPEADAFEAPEHSEPLPEPQPERTRDEHRRRSVALSTDRSGTWYGRAVVADSRGSVAESFRHIVLRLRRELEARHARHVAIVSALRGEGKTTIACNLALAFASLGQGRSVALVDLDLRKPSVARSLGLAPGEAGIEDVLRGAQSLREVCVSVERPALDVYPVRRSVADAHELLVRPELGVVLEDLARRYEITVLDTSPVLLVPDATVILERVGAAVAVARSGHTTQRGFEAMLEILPPDRVVGSILNEGALPAASRLYGYYSEEPEPGAPTEREASAAR